MYAFGSAANQLWTDPIDVSIPPNSPGGIYSVAISGDGKVAASGGLTGPGQGFAYTYDAGSTTGGKFVVFPNATWAPSSNVKMVALSGPISGNNYVLAAGADSLYVAIGSGTTWKRRSFSTPAPVEEVAVSADGQWIVAGLYGGQVMLVQNTNNKPEGLNAFGPQLLVNGSSVPGLAIAADGSGFAVGVTVFQKSGSVYYYNTQNFANNTASAPSWTATLTDCASCKWVSVSAHGESVSAVGKRNDGAGKLVVLQGQGSSPGSVIFTSNVVHSPNAVSLDNTGLKGAVADGSKKVHGQAAFHMFSAPAQTGPFTIQSLKVTGETNHGIKISASGNAIVGGSDDKKLYYFPVP